MKGGKASFVEFAKLKLLENLIKGNNFQCGICMTRGICITRGSDVLPKSAHMAGSFYVKLQNHSF